MLATRWFGWCSLVAAAAGAVALALPCDEPAPSTESWRELTYKTFTIGNADCFEPRATLERQKLVLEAERAAVDACFAAHGGRMGIRHHEDGLTTLLVEETSALAECLTVRTRQNFCMNLGFTRPPSDATLHVPARLGTFGTPMHDEFAQFRTFSEEEIARGWAVSHACSPSTPTFVGFPSDELGDSLSRCARQLGSYAGLAVTLDAQGVVTGVLAARQNVVEASCALATACGLQFEKGLGPMLLYY